MTSKKEIVGITLDPTTKSKIDRYGEAHGLSRSSAIRLIVNAFFLKRDGKNEF